MIPVMREAMFWGAVVLYLICWLMYQFEQVSAATLGVEETRMMRWLDVVMLVAIAVMTFRLIVDLVLPALGF